MEAMRRDAAASGVTYPVSLGTAPTPFYANEPAWSSVLCRSLPANSVREAATCPRTAFMKFRSGASGRRMLGRFGWPVISEANALRLVDRLYEAAVDPALWKSCLEALADEARAPAAGLLFGYSGLGADSIRIS